MRRWAILLLIIAALTAACGGDDAADTTADVEDAIDEAASDPAGAAEDAADAAEDAVATAEAAAGNIDAGTCQEAADALSAVPQALSGLLTGQADASEVQAQAEMLADLEVPEEYAADFEVVASTFTEIATALEGVDLSSGQAPDADTQARLTELSTSLADGEFATASSNVSAYFAGGCQQ